MYTALQLNRRSLQNSNSLPTTLTYERLCHRFRGKLFNRAGLLIGIEGYMGSGKTTLANRLSHDLALPLVRLDEFVAIRNGDNAYASRISRARLLRQVLHHSRRQAALVEGICLQAVLRHFGLRPATTVYVKRLSHVGLWHDGLNLEDFLAGNALDVDMVEPHVSDHRYHAAYAPHKSAHFVIERKEQ